MSWCETPQFEHNLLKILFGLADQITRNSASVIVSPMMSYSPPWPTIGTHKTDDGVGDGCGVGEGGDPVGGVGEGGDPVGGVGEGKFPSKISVASNRLNLPLFGST